jgi:hypothetical protein
MRERTKEEKHKELQDLHPNRFPHLDEIMIGGEVDLDLLFLFPQINSTNMGGIESRASFFEVNNGRERVWEEVTAQGGRRRPFRVLSKI